MAEIAYFPLLKRVQYGSGTWESVFNQCFKCRWKLTYEMV